MIVFLLLYMILVHMSAPLLNYIPFFIIIRIHIHIPLSIFTYCTCTIYNCHNEHAQEPLEGSEVPLYPPAAALRVAALCSGPPEGHTGDANPNIILTLTRTSQPTF